MAKNDDIHLLAEKISAIKQEHDTAEKLHELDKQHAVESALRENNWWWIKKLIGMCLSLWSFTLTACFFIGSFAYHHSTIIKAGVDAMLIASRSKHD